MNIDELEYAISIAHKARVSIFVSGPQGLGKSASAKNYSNNHYHFVERDDDGKVIKSEIPYGYVDLRCASMESSELRGLPDKDEYEGIKFVTYLPPDELPRGEWINNKGETYGEVGSEKPEDTDDIKWTLHKGILVLEEINRSEDDIHQALFQLVYDFQIGKWHLPTGWSIVATANPSGGGFIVNQFMHEPAFKDRFIHVNIELDQDYTKGWISYMQDLAQQGYDKTVLNKITQFCSLDPSNLSQSDNKELDEISVSPSPRSWEMVAKVETACILLRPELEIDDGMFNKIRTELISGIVGPELAAGYDECIVRVTPQDISENFDGVKPILKDLERNQLQALSWGVSSYANKLSKITDEIADNLIAFGKWLLKDTVLHHEDNRDLAVGYFDSLLQSEQKKGIRELSFSNTSMQKLLKKTNKGTFLFNKITKDKELNDLIHHAHRGQLDG